MRTLFPSLMVRLWLRKFRGSIGHSNLPVQIGAHFSSVCFASKFGQFFTLFRNVESFIWKQTIFALPFATHAKSELRGDFVPARRTNILPPPFPPFVGIYRFSSHVPSVSVPFPFLGKPLEHRRTIPPLVVMTSQPHISGLKPMDHPVFLPMHCGVQNFLFSA